MKTVLYYASWVVLPLLFIVRLVKNIARAVKNTVLEITADFAEHRRYYGKD